jgi:hypothetical protein
MLNPLKLICRLIVVSIAVLWLAHAYQRVVLTTLLPLIRTTLESVQDTFVVQSLDVSTDGPNEVLRMRSNFASPTYVNGRTFFPIGWQSTQQGGFEIALTAGGTLLYSLLTLIVILSWPVVQWREYVSRLVVALPLMLGLVLLNVGVTFPAELWKPIHDEWLAGITWPLLVASRMLMGGGGLILGLLCGAVAIALGSGWIKGMHPVSQSRPQTV